MRLVIAVLVVASAAGCHKHRVDRAERCKTAAHSGVANLTKRAHDRLATAAPDVRPALEAGVKQLDAIAARLEATLSNHCVDDRWPPAVIDCYANAAAIDEQRRCSGMLPPPAQDKLEADVLPLMMSDAPAPPSGLAPPAPAMPVSQAEHDAAVAEANKLAADLKALGDKVNAATQKVSAATTEADRQTAKQELDELTKQMTELKQKLVDAQARAR